MQTEGRKSVLCTKTNCIVVSETRELCSFDLNYEMKRFTQFSITVFAGSDRVCCARPECEP